MSPTLAGRLFHNAVADVWNDLSPRVFFVFPLLNCNYYSSSSDERSWYLHSPLIELDCRYRTAPVDKLLENDRLESMEWNGEKVDSLASPGSRF